ncbi:hypothetical protein IN07_11880 [Modestobacter caceresii]|jgi:hypothetical protein|uniref:Uncharacterized protein n=1 Tax=Modestobacter caceresii TaxID=1522368 RepID=A0A098Y6M1_9ACTN|nr:hypothetical protein [Modestobacter caceresii]KGH46533.1 hypothetical protein IN07_11880 [Modestobacter caceresii]
MPTYRLLNGYGIPLETFDADDDVEARVRAKELAAYYLPQGPRRLGRRPDFGLTRRDGDRWQPVGAWVPRPPD